MRLFPFSRLLLVSAAALAVLLPAGPLLSGDPQIIPVSAGSDGEPAAVSPVFVHAPSATCIQPRSQLASRVELTRFTVPIVLQVSRGDTASVLSRWESASREFEPVPVHEQRRLMALHHPGRSAHELDLICELRGPINARSLASRYRWHPPIAGGGRLEISAEPLESMERLFFRQFTLTFEGESFRPVSIQFTDGIGEKSVPFALETNLCLEARLARAARHPDDFGRAIIPAEYTVEIDTPAGIETPAPAEFPGVPDGRLESAAPPGM